MSEPRTIVITGCTRGLGRALSERFLQEGHAVAGCGRDAKAIEELGASPGRHLFEALDVTDDEALTAWAGRVEDRLGTPDLLINNAALINENNPLWLVPAEEFGRVIDVNIKGVAAVIRAFVPGMIARSSGVIVNISSGWGRSTSPEVGPYCATKWAIEGLTKSLAQELPRGMAAIPLNPGVIDTDMLRSCFGSESHAYPGPNRWVERAAPFILKLGPDDNGKSLSV